MRTRNDGFTLVELMIVVLIIGILVAVAVPVFKAAKADAEKATCQANQRTILSAVEAYRATPEAHNFATNAWGKVSPETWAADLVPIYYTYRNFRDGYYLVQIDWPGFNYGIAGDQGYANAQRTPTTDPLWGSFDLWWIAIDHRTPELAD